MAEAQYLDLKVNGAMANSLAKLTCDVTVRGMASVDCVSCR